MISLIIFFGTLFLFFPFTSVQSSCSDTEVACTDHSGSCTHALTMYLTSGGTSPREDIENSLRYGRYCGASNKCIHENIAQGDGAPEGPDGCNPIDDACRNHDSCLDEMKADSGHVDQGQNPIIPMPDRCPCEYGLVADLWMAKLARLGAFGDHVDMGELCDEGFYALYEPGSVPQIPAGAFEEDIIAIPYCFKILECLSYPEFTVTCPDTAICYCQALIGQLSSLIGGVSFNICDAAQCCSITPGCQLI